MLYLKSRENILNTQRSSNKLPLLFGALGLASITAPALAGAKIAIDENTFLTVGAGLRTSFSAVEDGAPNGDDYSTDFAVNNMRLYFGGQITDKISFTFNTDCEDCGSGGDMMVLDAIAQFAFTPAFNVWLGRMLTPADRIEMNGPFYGIAWNQYTVPLFPSDQGNNDAGKFGRDDGVTVWGNVGHFQYAVGAFDGYEGASNDGDNLLYAARLAYNFLNMEDNPGYYTSGTYFGGLGDILTLGFSVQYQADGTGTALESEDFTGYVVDLLWESVFSGAGVLTIDAEYKVFDAQLSDTARLDPACFCLFDGTSYLATAAWLFPAEIGMGKFQPYVRYTRNEPDDYADESDLYELGVNYVIKGHNAKVNLNYTNGDANLTGTPGADADAITLGVQLQI
jgi:hypothetical protein